MNKESDDEDDQEERVVEEVFKDVDLAFFEFSGIDFVEDLHQDETVEENTVVFSVFSIPVGNINTN